MSEPITSTTTAPKLTFLQEAEKIEAEVGVWLDAKHLILLGLLIVALLGGVYLWESKRADVAETKAEAATLVANAAKEAGLSSATQNAANQEQAKEVEAALVAANTQLSTANAQLITSNVQLSTKLVTQQKTDAVLPPSGQAQRWAQLVPTAQVSVTSTGFAIDAAGGLSTILALETVQTNELEIENFKKEVANDTQELANSQLQLKAEQIAHQSDVANDQKQLVAAQDNLKKTQDQFTAYKHKARKNEIRAFFIGVFVGVIGGHAAGF